MVVPQVGIALPPPPPENPPAQIDSQRFEAPAPGEGRLSTDENAGARFYQSPTAPPIVLNEYPSLVVLKSGGVYAVTKYWTKAKTLYFTTPNGQTFQTPLSLLEQVYPGTKSLKN